MTTSTETTSIKQGDNVRRIAKSLRIGVARTFESSGVEGKKRSRRFGERLSLFRKPAQAFGVRGWGGWGVSQDQQAVLPMINLLLIRSCALFVQGVTDRVLIAYIPPTVTIKALRLGFVRHLSTSVPMSASCVVVTGSVACMASSSFFVCSTCPRHSLLAPEAAI